VQASISGGLCMYQVTICKLQVKCQVGECNGNLSGKFWEVKSSPCVRIIIIIIIIIIIVVVFVVVVSLDLGDCTLR
jgi:t-SNARE complex subunit (syntaxin)